ncbi:MAG: 50S ribosomal protein L10 [Promicromonosporaceae bacterium]|nr:50S ribosomal protein L10 [Promicromonosporaceae bacterium]
MPTLAKNTAVAEIADHLRESNAAVLTEYRGLTVTQMKTLRRSIAPNATYAVVKNTLAKIAAHEVGITGFDAELQGPTAIAYITGEPVEVAKALRDFSRANPALIIKAGVLDGKPLTAAEVGKLADLESRDVLLAKAAGAMKAKLSQTAYVLVAVQSGAARAIDALRAKVEEAGGTLEVKSGAEAADVPEGADAPEFADAAETAEVPEGTDAPEFAEPVAAAAAAEVPAPEVPTPAVEA